MSKGFEDFYTLLQRSEPIGNTIVSPTETFSSLAQHNQAMKHISLFFLDTSHVMYTI